MPITERKFGEKSEEHQTVFILTAVDNDEDAEPEEKFSVVGAFNEMENLLDVLREQHEFDAEIGNETTEYVIQQIDIKD